jgi:hypothetical protein
MARRLPGFVLAAALVVAGVVVAFWPLHANGVSNNAVAPRYHPFAVGVTSYEPLPQHVTIADLRRLGVRVPQDAVEERRRLAAALAAAGLIVALTVALSAERPRRYSAATTDVDSV